MMLTVCIHAMCVNACYLSVYILCVCTQQEGEYIVQYVKLLVCMYVKIKEA